MKRIYKKIILVTFCIFISGAANSSNYKSIDKTIATCIVLASEKNNVPIPLLTSIYLVEAGKIGKRYKENDHIFLGPMKVNDRYVSYFAKVWDVKKRQARKMITDDPCTNIGVASFNFSRALIASKNLKSAITQYYLTSRVGDIEGASKYSDGVLKSIKDIGFLENETTLEKAQDEWLFIVYAGDVIINEPLSFSNLDLCLKKSKKMFQKNTYRRYHCLEPVSGKVYSGVTDTLIRKSWDKELPKSIQMGRRAPWLD